MGAIQRDLDLALANIQREQFLDAEAILKGVLERIQDSIECLNMLIFVSTKLQKYKEAAEYASRAIELAPQNAALRANFSLILISLKMFVEAEFHARESLKLEPHQPLVFDFLGQALIGQNRPQEAYEWILRAVAQIPDDSRMIYRLGTTLAMMGNYEEAELEFKKALSINPNDADVYTNLGVCLRYQGKYKEALVCFQKAVHIDPSHASAHLNRGSSWLLFGNYSQGWPEFSYRFLTHRVIAEKYMAPLWGGESFHGKRILLHAEQGFGDTIQFIRYAPIVKAVGGEVYFECPTVLMRWLENHPGIDQLVRQGEKRPEHDLQAPLMSLPSILRTSIDTIPDVINPMEDVAGHRQASASISIGIVWAGNPTHADDKRRSCAVEDFLSLREVPNIRLISLQKGQKLEKMPDGILDGVKDCSDFVDTARVIQGLDLVITVDTSIAHLAATMGKPTWILLGIPNDWRWLLEREDSPWYPSVRLYRQNKIGDWTEVFNRIKSSLRSFKSEK